MNKNLIYALLVILALGVGFYFWKSNSTTDTPTKPTKTEKTIPPTTETTTETTPAPAPSAGTTTETTAGTTTETTPVPTPAPTPTPDPVDLTPKGDCVPDIGEHLSSYAATIEAQNVAYNVTDLSDCSGMFLRLMKHMKTTCPDYLYPNETEHRDTRLLGKWFHDNNNLVLVNDIKNHVHRIIPGAVLFYGQRDMVYDNLTVEKLTTRGEGIEHVGVVTDITKEGDVVTKYSLYHGRTYGKPAGRTRYHTNKEKTKNGKLYPAYGNGRQAIIAIGYVTTNKPPN